MNDASRQQTREIAERLPRADGGGEARLTTTAEGFRIELSVHRPAPARD